MAQSDRIPCEILVIGFPRLDLFDHEKKEKFIATITEMRDFVGKPQERKGIIGTVRLGNSLAGFYVEEGLREGLHGNNPADLVPSEDSNYEKLFFALLFEQSLVILQRTSLFHYANLSYPQMKRDFFLLLGDLLERAGMPVDRVQFEKYYKKRTQEEMQQLFFANTAIEVEVIDLRGKRVPENIKLSNPDPEEEPLLRRIYEGDFNQIDEEWLKAATGRDLRKTKTGKAAIGAGTVRKIVSQPPDGEAETFYIEQDEKIDAAINTNKRYVTEDELQHTVQLVERRLIMPASVLEHRPLSDFGPLFSSLGDKHE